MPVPPDPDAILMLRVKRGDRAAFAELVDKYKQPVMNFVYRSLRDETEAEDLAQNVFLQVYKSRSRYKQTAKFSTWLFTIARNLCLNEFRRRSRHPAESIEETQADNEDQPQRQYEDKSQMAAAGKTVAGGTGPKNRGGAGRTAGKPAQRHFALPAGGVELRGNRRCAGLLAFGHEIAHPSRPRNAQGKAQTLSKHGRLGGMIL